ncbi:uncharacterized protein GLRG_08606 [Colletotrichum graminicola M1.001]|uniref:Uncharacterized protein n=1 Tax=Colletotrichum graminicola (strain M1.001 / M2 / FGSC 10212) TaxID=645133 RepID=E3QS39_COLGM|nr:uncharacterized protein GLRG_08606 [Colletotrichum graminicola M1.001]EFQ33677.1 hypothetical protein GLRG_08606 [Colletotrichum graminicola M1.001]
MAIIAHKIVPGRISLDLEATVTVSAMMPPPPPRSDVCRSTRNVRTIQLLKPYANKRVASEGSKPLIDPHSVNGEPFKVNLACPSGTCGLLILCTDQLAEDRVLEEVVVVGL